MLYAIDMTLGKRIQKARRRLKPIVTQKTIGDAFRISDQAVSSWERDETIPDVGKMPKLARLLKVPTDWLIEGPGDPPNPDDIEVEIQTLPPSDQAVVRATIAALRKRRVSVA